MHVAQQLLILPVAEPELAHAQTAAEPCHVSAVIVEAQQLLALPVSTAAHEDHFVPGKISKISQKLFFANCCPRKFLLSSRNFYQHTSGKEKFVI